MKVNSCESNCSGIIYLRSCMHLSRTRRSLYSYLCHERGLWLEDPASAIDPEAESYHISHWNPKDLHKALRADSGAEIVHEPIPWCLERPRTARPYSAKYFMCSADAAFSSSGCMCLWKYALPFSPQILHSGDVEQDFPTVNALKAVDINTMCSTMLARSNLFHEFCYLGRSGV